ncbi:PQQ-like beta-propeller repeat protein [Kiloniella sp. b19]|uniref:PQQ-like beta-propeller repeat protein n=1 Tax=Kiloniella sp. GXU_MW_B19 TaxID=3141326 RepID=UPI0031D32676
MALSLRLFPRASVAGLLLLSLSACDTINDLIGEGDGPPLPGARIAIQTEDRGISADSSIADQRIVLPAPFENKVWSHSGGNAIHAMFHLQLSEAPSERWSQDIGEASDYNKALLAQPIVVDPVIFSMDAEGTVHAFDKNTGREYWSRDLTDLVEDEGGFGGGLAYSQGRLYVTTGFAWIFALDARSGAVQWSQRAPGPMRAAPTVNGGRVFAVTLDNQTVALAANDGRRLWTHLGAQQDASILGGASPAVAGRMLVVPYSSGELVALDAVDGDERWSFDLSALRRTDPLTDLAHIRGLPVIDRDRVIAISHSGRMVALDLNNGSRIWDIDVGGIQTPWVAGEYIYVLSNDAQVVAVRRRDGRIRWVQPLPQFTDEDRDEPITWYGPVLASDRLIVAGSYDFAVSLSPYTGDILSYIELSNGAALPPVVAGNSLYLLNNDADLIAYQ